MFSNDGFGALIELANGRGGFGDVILMHRINSITQDGHIILIQMSELRGVPVRTVVTSAGYRWEDPYDGHYWPITVSMQGRNLQIQDAGSTAPYTVTLYYSDGTTSTASGTLGQTPTPPPTPPNFTTFVTNMYQEIYHRAPDAAGLAFWVGRAQAEWTARGQAGLDAIRQVFLTTPDNPPATTPPATTPPATTPPATTPPATTGGGIFDTLMNGHLSLLGFNIPYWMLGAGAVGAYMVFGDDGGSKRRR
jgi:hypothetical protein